MRILSLLFVISLLLAFIPQPTQADNDKYAHMKNVPVVVDDNTVVTYTGKHYQTERGDEMWEYKAKIYQAPMFNEDGTTVDCGFKYRAPALDESGKIASQAYYEITDNIFSVRIEGTKVTTEYQGETSTYDPVVYVGSQAYTAKKMTLIAVDPINSYYKNNIIEWDYGVCIRRVRVIEGLIQETFTFDKDPKGAVWIKDNQQITKGYVWSIEPYAYDADGNSVTINEYKQVSASDMAKATYPVTIDPTDTFVTSASDGCTMNSNTNWDTAWVAASSSGVYGTLVTTIVGSYYSMWTHYVSRAYVFFDTSTLPDGAVISAAKLGLYGASDLSATDFNITVQNGQPTYPHDPVQKADYDKSKYSGDGGTFGTAGFSTAGYNELTLNADGRNWINKAGVTKFCLRSSRDISGTAPAGNEYVGIYSYEKGAGYRPYLEVTYVSSGPPTVTTNPATYVATTSARLNGLLDADGGEACDVSFEYLEWYNTSWSDVFAVTINPTYIDADLTGFPVLVTGDGVPDNFWTTVGATGEDIVVTDASLNKLPRELVSIDTVAETMELYFNASSIDDTAETHFYIWYGGVEAETNDTATWDSDFVLVTHAVDDPDTSHVADSTSNNNNGTKSGAGTPTESAGYFSSDMAQEASGADYIGITDGGEFWLNDSVSIGGLFYVDITKTSQFLINKRTGASGRATFELRHNNATVWFVYRNSTNTAYHILQKTLALTTGWHTIWATHTYGVGANSKIYIDGVDVSASWSSGDGNEQPMQNDREPLYLGDPVSFIADGGKTSDVQIYHGILSGAWVKASYNSLMNAAFYGVDDTDAYETTANQSKNTGGAWHNDITGLTINTDYGYRAVATNSNGETNGDWVLFDTTVVLTPPTNVVCDPEPNSIKLTWVKGGNSYATYIRYKTGGYPTSLTDGSAIPLQSGVNYEHSGLPSGVTYYYRMWGEDGGTYSATNTTIMCTTLAGYATSTPNPLPTVDTSSWSANPNGSVLENNPLYALGNLEADEVGVPHNTWWMLLGLGALVCCGLFIYTRTRDTVATIGAIILFGALMAQAGLFPIWVIIIFGLVGIGFGWKGLR